MFNRETSDADPRLAFTSKEIEVLRKITATHNRMTFSDCVLQLAKLGGYLARSKDPPPGNTVVWRRLARLSDIVLGKSL